MNRGLKFLGFFVGLAVLAVGGLLLWLTSMKPAQRPPPAEKIEATPERLARGKYLVHHVAECVGCHSEHHWDRFGMPVKPGTLLQGGFTFDEKFAVPGRVSAQNLTTDMETGKGSWTDGELLRAIREGVSKDGHARFPMMPYKDYRQMSDEDAKAIVAYLRTIPAVKNKIPPTEIAFPVNLLIKFEPQPLSEPVPPPKDRGRYLTVIAGCIECHTPHDDKGQRIAGRELSGGWEMVGPWGRNITPNITPHPKTFVGRSTKEQFVARFKSFATVTGTAAPMADPGRNTVMPWLPYSGMTEEDLAAIYDYLKSVPPIENDVEAFLDAPGT